MSLNPTPEAPLLSPSVLVPFLVHVHLETIYSTCGWLAHTNTEPLDCILAFSANFLRDKKSFNNSSTEKHFWPVIYALLFVANTKHIFKQFRKT
jgi:hypothetical protein